MRIFVENIKCGGCANSIRKGLLGIDGVVEVEVGIEEGWVDVTTESVTRDRIVEQLVGMGYPEAGSVQGLSAAGAKARSFVSCAVGRLGGE